MSAILVAGFPGIGKTYAFNTLGKQLKILDSDSSKFDKSDFPKNYIEHIKENIANNDIIFISSHKEVREALEMENIDFDLFYPSKDRRNEFLENYVTRHSPRDLIMKIDNHWNEWIDEIEHNDNKNCHIHCLSHTGEFIGNNPMIMTYVNQVIKAKENKNNE